MVEPTNNAAAIILSYAARKKRRDLLKALGMAESTFLSRLRNPGAFSLSELAALQRFLRVPDEAVLQILDDVKENIK